MQKDDNGIPIESERDLLIKIATDTQYIKKDIREIKEVHKTHDDRLGSLERWRAYVLGFAAAISFVIYLVFSLWVG
jgi:hypothetical protein